jgi:hypothetical protein
MTPHEIHERLVGSENVYKRQVERDVREPRGELGRLGTTPIRQRAVGEALPPAGAVPVALAVAGEQKRRHADILPLRGEPGT